MADADLPKINEEKYLGDGVYVSFDGYQVTLRTERMLWNSVGGLITHYIALEPVVYTNLRKWIHSYPRLALHMEGTT